jgi:hypothetical protein
MFMAFYGAPYTTESTLTTTYGTLKLSLYFDPVKDAVTTCTAYINKGLYISQAGNLYFFNSHNKQRFFP